MKKYLVTLFAISLLFSCRNETLKSIEPQIGFGDSVLNKFNPENLPEIRLNLCEVFKSDWDSLLVFRPYGKVSKLDDIGLANPEAVRSEIRRNAGHDRFTSLLFVKNNRIVKYQKVYNSTISFSGLGDSTNNIPIISTKDCAVILKRTSKDSERPQFILLSGSVRRVERSGSTDFK